MESERLTTLACIGLSARSAAPPLLHAIRGCLHDLTMLTALLQSGRALRAQDGGEASEDAQRLRSIARQLQRLERNVALLDAMTDWPEEQRGAVCATASALPDVVRLLRDDAARRCIRFEHELDALPAQIAADERSLQRALLACGAWTAQRTAQRETMRLSGRADDTGAAVFEFAATGERSPDAPRDDVPLLSALVRAAGGTLASAPLRATFARAAGQNAAAAW